MSTVNKIRFSGVFPILATPFNEDGSVDYDSLKELVRFELTAEVDGLGLFGMASETYTLLASEKYKIAEVVKNEIKGRIPLIFGSGHTSAEGAVQLSIEAQRQGADALMVMAPSMVKPDGKRLYEYFAKIAHAVDIPIMIQDAPLASNVNIPSSLIAKLAKEFENIQYVKVEAPPTIIKIAEILEATQGDVTVFGGMNGMYMYEEFLCGSAGTMPACEFPDVAVSIYRNFINGKHDEAREIFYKYLPMIRIGTLPNYAMSVHKEILKKGGVIKSAYVRNPNSPLDDETRKVVFETLKNRELLALNWNKRNNPST
ncbi:MAG TPA: dihydrodipicolinate synthase family protein [Clostridiaceae bacterium]|nr:dihydrodipicolinate synthase family protein [Clostridiaceae bacterium]